MCITKEHSLAYAHAHVQRLVSVVKMVTVLEDCTTKEQYCVGSFVVKTT
jgi:hypothetical protein